MPPGKSRQPIGIGSNQGGNVLSAVAVYQDVANQSFADVHVLQKLWRDLLTAGGYYDVLLTIFDLQIIVGIKLANVAGEKPAIAKRLPGGLFVFVITDENAGAFDHNL